MSHTTNREKPTSLNEAIAAHEETLGFQGDALTGESADLDGIPPYEKFEEPAMSGHPATEESEEPDSEKSHFTYESQEEAEKAVTETDEAVARLSRELREVQDLALQTLQGGGYPETPDPEPPSESSSDFMRRRRREALDEIEELDWSDQDYKDRVAAIQAEADQDILKYHQEESARLAAQRDREETETQAVIDQAEAAMKAAGLNPSIESEDSILFWALTEMAPSRKDGLPLSLDEQIQWTINRTLTYKNQALDDYKAQGKPEVTNPATLEDIMDQVAESRRA